MFDWSLHGQWPFFLKPIPSRVLISGCLNASAALRSINGVNKSMRFQLFHWPLDLPGGPSQHFSQDRWWLGARVAVAVLTPTKAGYGQQQDDFSATKFIFFEAPFQVFNSWMFYFCPHLQSPSQITITRCSILERWHICQDEKFVKTLDFPQEMVLEKKTIYKV